MSAFPPTSTLRAGLAAALVLTGSFLRASEPAPIANVVQDALAASAAQYEWMLAHLPPDGKLPRTFEHGKLVTVNTRDWTSGFFPGSLWYLFEATGDAKWRSAAERYTALLSPEQHNTRTHDVGFILDCSYGNGYRLTGDPAYRAVLLQGAKSLATRFNPTVGAIKSWDRDPKIFTFPVIIDNMMNLELLVWATGHGGDPQFRTIALTHADTTRKNHFRPDGSSFHVVDYDPATGRVLRRLTHQGAANDSAWARGQAWGLYAFTYLYRETHDARYLAQAEKIAAFIMPHPRLPADKIPYWDFDAPGQPDAPRDSSAAAIMSSALFELAGLTGNPAAAKSYAAFAEAQLRSLASPAYLARPGENGGFLLKHATGNFPKSSEVDVPLNYGDYYFLEALLRCRARTAPGSGRQTINFNPDWHFLKADPTGAAAPSFDDSAWAIVSAPHTFNDTDTFDNWSLPGHRGEQDQWSGRTWYRKTFTAPAAWQGKKVFIEFEAVRQVAEVYLNGQKLGTAKGGFTPFGFDLTPHLKIGAPNVLAVMADNRFMKDPMDPKLAPQAATTAATHPNLAQVSKLLMEKIPDTLDELQADQIPWNNPHWHPAHGGIYRNVRLIVTDPLHITLPLYSFLQTEGPYVYATDISAAAAKVGLEVPVRNDRTNAATFAVSADVIDADGRTALHLAQAATLTAGATEKFTLSDTLPHPRLWEPGYPHLYRVVLTLSSDGHAIDTTEIPFGIRAIRWSATTGLWVNGAHYKLHGWGQKATSEWPGLGAAQPDWLQAYTLQLMKDAGGNFVRWGHVPAGPAQIAAGDQFGIVALQPGGDGESDTRGGAWALRVADFRDVLIYYRNNPSIFIWEGGNQKVSRAHAAELRALMDKFDPHGGRAYAHRRADAITAEFMDVGIGTEGGREIARLPVVEGEYDREESPRRVWDDASPPNFGYPEGKGQTYQLTSEQFAVNEVAQYVSKLGAPSHAGGANWIFSDSTSGGRVGTEVARAGGEVDGVRLPKEAYYVCQVMFTYTPRVHLIGHWSYPPGTRKTIYAAANTSGEVELFLNGRSLGRAQPKNQFLYTFPNVAFEPGELTAVAYDRHGQAAARTALHTVGPAVALKLTPIVGPDGFRADGSDIALFVVEVIDARGDRVPTFQQRVDFQLDGPAIWRGSYNSGKINSINNPYLDLEAGINRVALRSTRTAGQITLHVRGEGLQPASSTITAEPFTGAEPAFPAIALPASIERQPASLAPTEDAAAGPAAGQAGRFIKTFNYTGPNASIVHVETNAQAGRNAYVDADSPLPTLPASLVGADWVQVANRDALYSAVDLMELTVSAGTVVTIAHDDRLPLPPWLLRDFAPTGFKLVIVGQPMSLFTKTARAEAGLTFGPNTEDSSIRVGHMYLVFVTAAPAAH